MKKKILLILPLLSILSLPAIVKANPYLEAGAYTVASLPTTIDLNDSSEETIRNYYSSLNSLANEEKQGTNLLKNLKPILKNNQKYYSYDSGSKVWQAYEITDRDWELSPANEIKGYNAESNTITGYVYGTSAKNSGDNPYIHALYINRDVKNNVRAWAESNTTTSSHGNNKEWHIDREHVWPKSFGFENEAEGGARGDLMHLIAGDSYVNSALHSNYYYGYVDTTRDYIDGKDKYSEVSGNLMGFSKTLGGNVTVFEPQDSDKGDIARAVFYMMARYNYLSGSDSDEIDSNNPNLEIVNDLTSYSKSGYMSSKTTTGKIGLIQDLLEWNKLDPVDEYEIHRNNLLFNNYTFNRNPFIDFPQWADIVWGESSAYARPSSDSINNSIISLSKNRVSIEPNKTFLLTATTTENVQISWSISDNTVLSLDKTVTTSGEQVTFTTLKEGKAAIKASITVEDVVYEKSCIVNVAVNNKSNGLFAFLGNLSLPVLIGIIAFIVIVIIVIIVILAKSKKARKVVSKSIKKSAKKAVKKGAKKKK